jgi:2-keto-4-pentenoate hydratase/2-oxohepta-3-ene-1,7-dioic acid hydratase in catechol pathway
VRLARFTVEGGVRPLTGEVRGGRAITFEEQRPIEELIASRCLHPANGRSFDLAEVRLLAPIQAPRAIFGIGMNYEDHIAETGSSRPDQPLVFLKLPSSAAPGNGEIRCPAVVKRLDYEGELAVVIGAGGSVAGYAIADDLTARDLQKRESQWTRAKGADGFCPYGPWITTVDEVPNPHQLALRTWVNGQLRQNSSTANMLFAIDELIEFISQTCTLAPGDLILTGTPSGVGMAYDPPRFLQSGDVVRIEIERLGSIEHRIA